MATSIAPVKDSASRIDQGATWFRDYLWSINGTPIDLAGYDISASIHYPGTFNTSCTPAIGPYTVGSGVTKSPTTGEFEIRIPAADTDSLDFGFEKRIGLVLTIDLTRTGVTDPITNYKTDEVLRLVCGVIVAYSRCAGSAP